VTVATAPVFGARAIRRRRRTTETAVRTLLGLAALLAAGLLLVILGYVVVRGLPALTPAFFTQRPLPFGVEGGGVAPAIIGTVVLGAIAAVIAVPVGIAAAVFAVEYRAGRFAAVVRFSAELIAGLPSIVVGVFVWAFLVRTVIGHYAGLAGGVALAVIMIPIVARTVEEVLRLVPASLREAAMALGAPRWRVILRIVIPSARAGITTAVILAVARAAGETAPLLLTALGNVYFSGDLLQPMAALPLQIYQYAVSPYEDWHTKAWGSSLILVSVVAAMSGLLRFALRGRVR
jgi:phosphate transport system permease protein